METTPAPVTPPPYGSQPPIPPKKGLGTGAKVGIGCGAVVLLLLIAAIVAGVLFGGKLKNFAEQAQKDPARASAEMMISMSGGKFQMAAEDPVAKRYTVKDSKGNLTTIYWDEAKKAPVTIQGDFSAIPASPAPAPAP
jgi:hypothetical protein